LSENYSMIFHVVYKKNVGTSIFRLVTVHAFDRRTGGHFAHGYTVRALHYMQSHGEK